MQTILLIEDQVDFQMTVKALLAQRYHLVIADSVSEAMKCVEAGGIDLVLLDVNLPDGDGFQLFSRIKSNSGMKNVPVIFLTGKGQVNDRVAAFSLGAEDYIVKPFEPLEFRARVEAKLSAKLNRELETTALRKGRLLLDQAKFRASTVDSTGKMKDLDLTPHEFRLLHYFVTHEGHILSRDQLMSVVWGTNVHVMERTIDRHVSALRKKLDLKFEILESVHGVGYRLTILTGAPAQKAVS